MAEKPDIAGMPALSVIVPTLDTAAQLPACLRALAEGAAAFGLETIVSDGGSTDGAPDVAEAFGARLVKGPKGRGRQLAAGAAAAGGAWLLFLHADTVLAPGWSVAVRAHIDRQDGRADATAAHFRFALDSAAPAARRLERMVAWRCRVLGLPYGDQGLLIARARYDALGGFRDLPLMEDVDLVRRIGRRGLVALPATARTSAARYLRDGWLRRSARNLLCLALYFLGVAPRHIARIYG